jgi:general secretion pathway protein M
MNALKEIKYRISQVIRKLEIFFSALEEREKVILIIGAYAVVIILGIFFITDKNVRKYLALEKKLDREIKNYIELKELASEYMALKGVRHQTKNVSLKDIENLARKIGIKNKIVSLKPFQEGIEISLDNLTGNEVIRLIRTLKREGLNVSKISIEKRGKNFSVKISIVNR